MWPHHANFYKQVTFDIDLKASGYRIKKENKSCKEIVGGIRQPNAALKMRKTTFCLSDSVMVDNDKSFS